MGNKKNKGNLIAELEKELIEKIEIACHDFLIRRNPAAALLG